MKRLKNRYRIRYNAFTDYYDVQVLRWRFPFWDTLECFSEAENAEKFLKEYIKPYCKEIEL